MQVQHSRWCFTNGGKRRGTTSSLNAIYNWILRYPFFTFIHQTMWILVKGSLNKNPVWCTEFHVVLNSRHFQLALVDTIYSPWEDFPEGYPLYSTLTQTHLCLVWHGVLERCYTLTSPTLPNTRRENRSWLT